MNPAVILALIADLYGQVAQLTQERDRLLQQLEGQPAPKPVRPESSKAA